MKKGWILLICVLVLIFIGAFAAYNQLSEQYTPSQQGEISLQSADDFTVFDGDGNPVSLSGFRGKPVVINFWATWCGPCKSELPAFNALYQKYGDRVQFMMVNLTDGARETMDGVKHFMTDAGYSFPVFYDTTAQAANIYRVSSVPMSFFITADGMKKASYIGPMSQGILENYIKKILGGN